MARRVQDKTLDTRAARGKLKARGKPYWRQIERGLHLGYRRISGKAGTWWTRHYLGEQEYEIKPLGAADDLSDADGVAVLSFWQAQEQARKRHVTRAHSAAGIGPLTISSALDAYFEHLEARGKSASHQHHHARAFIIPPLGEIELSALTTAQLNKWLHNLAKEPPRVRTAPGQPQQYRSF
jgi:hypothetical protein